MSASPRRRGGSMFDEAQSDEAPARDVRTDEPSYLTALDALSVPELNAVLERAEKLKVGKLEAARQVFISRAKAEAQQLGLDLGSMFGAPSPARRSRKPGGSTSPVPARFRGPNGE